MSIWEVLFNNGEKTAYGDRLSTTPYDLPPINTPEFFCINPLDSKIDHAYIADINKYNKNKPRRADLNVSCFRNFLFEMDSVPLNDQLKIIELTKLPFTSITYSGGKSYHSILSIDGLAFEPNTILGIQEYKNLWLRIAAYIDFKAKQAGFEYPDNKPSFLDHSCKNPSRLSRAPNYLRENGNVQTLLQINKRLTYDEWVNIDKILPKISLKEIETIERPKTTISTEGEFFALAPKGLTMSIKYIDWAASEGMYPIIFRLCLWAIDTTNVNEDCLTSIFHKYVTPILQNHNYDKDRVDDAISKAYYYKNQKGI